VEVRKRQSEENLMEELRREEEEPQRGGTGGRDWRWGRREHAFLPPFKLLSFIIGIEKFKPLSPCPCPLDGGKGEEVVVTWWGWLSARRG
jgi:hypothetical protein